MLLIHINSQQPFTVGAPVSPFYRQGDWGMERFNKMLIGTWQKWFKLRQSGWWSPSQVRSSGLTGLLIFRRLPVKCQDDLFKQGRVASRPAKEIIRGGGSLCVLGERLGSGVDRVMERCGWKESKVLKRALRQYQEMSCPPEWSGSFPETGRMREQDKKLSGGIGCLMCSYLYG